MRTYDDDMPPRRLCCRHISCGTRAAVRGGAGGIGVTYPTLQRRRAGQVVHARQHLRHDAAFHLPLRRLPLAGDGIDLICGRRMTQSMAESRRHSSMCTVTRVWNTVPHQLTLAGGDTGAG